MSSSKKRPPAPPPKQPKKPTSIFSNVKAKPPPAPASASAPLPPPKPAAKPILKPFAPTPKISKHPIPTKPPPRPVKPRSRTVYFAIGGVAIYSLTAYTFWIYSSISKLPAAPREVGLQEDCSAVYDANAGSYDEMIKWSERLMGMGWLRWGLVRKARGEVLELSVGTGRNMGDYRLGGGGGVESVTFVDKSREMLEVGRRRFYEMHPNYKNAHFLVQEAEAPVSSPTGKQFDTILQTMGLCSVRDPVAELRRMGSQCKPDGQILLLEHGRSGWEWLDGILDRLAGGHAKKWGCWFNRDIEGLVRESGLQVRKISRYHFGTTYWIECGPPVDDDEKEEKA